MTSIDDADDGFPVLRRKRDRNRFPFRRNLGCIFNQVGESGAHGARNNTNPQIAAAALHPHLGPLLNRFQGDRPHQHAKICLFGLRNLLGAEGEKGPQPAIDPSDLRTRRGDEILSFPRSRSELFDREAEGVERVAKGVRKAPRKVAELRQVQSVAKATKTPLTMLLPMRFDPKFVAMRDIVKRGEIGEAVNLSGQKSYQLGERPDWMTERETFGGTIPYIACHTVDLLRFISGREASDG